MDQPDQQQPNVDPSPDGAAERVWGGLLCMRCGYDLTGLASDGVCPECGTPVADSMRGNLLADRSPEYVRTLKRGLSLVLNGILLWFVVIFLTSVGTAFLGVSAGASGSAPPSFITSGWLTLFSGAINLGFSAMILFGYWLFTARDPGDPVRDGAPTARNVLRVAVIVQASCDALSLLLTSIVAVLAGPQMLAGSAVSGSGGVYIMLIAVSSLLGLVSFAAFVTIFFSAMLYVKGMAHRLPDDKVRRQAKSRIIACPIWATVGFLIIIGPLIALVLYWNLLNLVRTNLKRIVAEQTALAA